MSDNTVLLTGASGFVGFRILQRLIEEGFRLRLAVRSEAKFTALKEALERADKVPTNLEHVIVADMTQPDAFKAAINGVDYVVHVASPLAGVSGDLDVNLIQPAVAMTLGILHTIQWSPERSVKKIVITSSVAGVSPAEPKSFDADHVEPDPKGPWPNYFAAYAASKKLALNATRRFIKEQSPYFDIINVLPSFVIGPNGFARSRKEYQEGSNALLMAPLLGTENPSYTPGFACHVDDVAAVHVAALRPSITGHRNYGVNYDGMNGIEWNNAIDIVKQKLPEAVGADGFPLGGSALTAKTAFDASKTERDLGMTFKDFDTMVLDLAKAYLAAQM